LSALGAIHAKEQIPSSTLGAEILAISTLSHFWPVVEHALLKSPQRRPAFEPVLDGSGLKA
jgi:hypothetical protein